MRTIDVVKFYGGRRAVALVLGLHRQAIYQWSELVPEAKAARLERLSGGRLAYDPALYMKRNQVRAPRSRKSETATMVDLSTSFDKVKRSKPRKKKPKSP